MEMQLGYERYWTTFVEDCTDGFAGFRVHRERFGKNAAVVAEVIYWDANGQYTVQTFDTDVPVEIIEATIAETKQRVRVR